MTVDRQPEGSGASAPWPLGPSSITTPSDSSLVSAAGLRRLVIHPTPGLLDKALARELLLALASPHAPISLDLHIACDAVEQALVCQERHSTTFQRLIYGVAPAWDVGLVDEPPSPSTGLPSITSVLHASNRSDLAPFADLDAFRASDPLTAIYEAVQPLTNDEALMVRYLVQPVRPERRQRAHSELFVKAPLLTPADLIAALFGRRYYLPRFEPRLQRQLEERLSEIAFEMLGVITLRGPDPQRLRDRARTLRAIFESRFDAQHGGLALSRWEVSTKKSLPPPGHAARDSWLLLTPAELSPFWHPLSSPVLTPMSARSTRPPLHLPLELVRARGIPLGVHYQRAEDILVHLPLPDLCSGPLVILGKTGVGKTTIAHQALAAAARLAPNSTVCVIDPHGDAAVDIAARSIPPAKLAQTYLIELGDSDWPIGLPILSKPPGLSQDAFISTTFQAIKLIFREHWSPTRMETAVHATVSLLCQTPGSTLLDVPRLYSDPAYRRRLLTDVGNDPAIIEFFQVYEALSDGARRELVAPILHRLSAFYRARPIRNIVCRTSGLDLAQLLSEEAIILISLAGSDIEAEADLLMELLITRVHLGLRARLTQPAETRNPVFIAIDESQRIKGPTLPALIAEGRKTGASPILLTQFLANWSEQLSQAILGNNASLIAFAVGPDDSRKLAPILRPFTGEQLLDLDRHEAIAKIQVNGHAVPAFDIKTLPVTSPRNDEVLEQIRAQTRARFARPRQTVEKAFSTPSAASSVRSPGWEIFDVDPV